MKRLLWATFVMAIGFAWTAGVLFLVVKKWIGPLPEFVAALLVAGPLTVSVLYFAFTLLDTGRSGSRRLRDGTRIAKLKIGARGLILVFLGSFSAFFAWVGFLMPSGFWGAVFQTVCFAFGGICFYFTIVLQIVIYRWNDEYFDCPNVWGWPRLHEWSKLEAVSNFSEGMEWQLMFSETGKARIPYFLEGCDELVALAKEKLNDA